MTSVDWTLTEPTPQNQTSICQTERCLCSKKPSSSKLVSLRGLFLLVIPLSSGCKQRWVLLSFSLQWHKHSGNQGWNLQCLKKPLFPDRLLSMCPQFSSTWAFLVPCVLALPSHTFADPWWSLWCRHLASSLSAHLSLGWDLSVHGEYWVVSYHSAKMGFRSRVWEEEALCLCMFDTSLRSGLFQLWKCMFLGRSVMAGLLPGKRSQSWGL